MKTLRTSIGFFSGFRLWRVTFYANGRLAEKGRHRGLISRSKIYKELWNLRVGGYIS